MNNIRKIIEERLENARNDWLLDKRDYLRGQMVSYRDCLNLLHAPRTEQEILNDFEKLGWKVVDGYVNFTLKKNVLEKGDLFNYDWHCYISINKENKTYNAIKICHFTTKGYDLSIQEHKLLNELFEVW